MRLLVSSCAVLLLCPALLAGTYTGPGGAIPPSGTSGTSVFDISIGAGGALSDVNVTLTGFSHSFAGDLNASVTHVDTGTVVSLFPNQGGSSNYGGTYTFDDEAGAPLAGVTPGTYQPAGSLSSFDGESVVGTWRLTINDTLSGDSGSLASWTLTTIEGAAIPEPSTVLLFLFGGLAMGAAGVVKRRRTARRA